MKKKPIGVTLDQAQRDLIEAAADELGCSAATFIRLAAIREAKAMGLNNKEDKE